MNLKWIPFSENYEKIKADVGTNTQVRSTNHRYGNLLVHDKDDDEQGFVLVRLHNLPECEMVGWVYGKTAKDKKYWEDGTNRPSFKGRACYMYPANLLNPMDTYRDE